jgi:hypothetical protein
MAHVERDSVGEPTGPPGPASPPRSAISAHAGGTQWAHYSEGSGHGP